MRHSVLTWNGEVIGEPASQGGGGMNELLRANAQTGWRGAGGVLRIARSRHAFALLSSSSLFSPACEALFCWEVELKPVSGEGRRQHVCSAGGETRSRNGETGSGCRGQTAHPQALAAPSIK